MKINVKISNTKPMFCEKCNGRMYGDIFVNLKCHECGALYQLDKNQEKMLEDNSIDYIYVFKKFVCTHQDYKLSCENECPSSHMFCLSHLQDKSFDDINSTIISLSDRIEKEKRLLDKMTESRKTWYIKEMAGL